MELQLNAINWFEIPVSNFERAQKFYSEIFDYEMPTMQMGPVTMGFLLYKQGEGVGGAICAGEGYEPSTKGTKVYLNADPDLSRVLDRVENAGGKIRLPKTFIAEGLGYFAVFADTEGNEISLHSSQ